MTTTDESTSFETERLRLRRRTLADTDACIAMDREPDVVRFVSGPWSDPSAHRAFVEERTLGPWPSGMGYWTIWSRELPAGFLGWILLIPVDAIGPEIEIGWRLRPQCWGKGIATEAARPVLAHAFATLRLDEVIAEIATANTGSLRVAEKIGLQRRGPIESGGVPAIRYALTSTEFSQRLPSAARGAKS